MRLFIHDIDPELYLDLIEARFPDLEISTRTSYEGVDVAVERARPQFVLTQVFAGLPYPRQPILACEDLEWLHVIGAGIDHLAPWDPARITVTSSATVQANAMAQYALGGLFSFNFHFPDYLHEQAERRWVPRPVISATGKTLLVVGLGAIGRVVARRAGTMGFKVIGVRRRAEAIDDVEQVFGTEDLHHALGLADAVLITAPLTDATRNLIDATAFAAMKPDTVFINMARGPIVDEPSLVAALREGRLRGAVLDVFETEPLAADSPLWALDNVILTPHVSSVFEGWEREAVELFCDNLEHRLGGEPMANVITP